MSLSLSRKEVSSSLEFCVDSGGEMMAPRGMESLLTGGGEVRILVFIESPALLDRSDPCTDAFDVCDAEPCDSLDGLRRARFR